MGGPTFDANFFRTTRGRVVELLRRGSRTVEELAGELEVTDNAVRLHLAALEEAGLVRVQGTRRAGTVGKPALIYEMDPAGEAQLSRAYQPFLTTLLGALGTRLDARELRALMRDVGRRLSGGARASGRSLAARTEAAAALLNDLGGVATVERGEEDGGGLVIRGGGCPLAAAVQERAEVCVAVQTLVAEITHADVREQCDRAGGGRPQCRFHVVPRRS